MILGTKTEDALTLWQFSRESNRSSTPSSTHRELTVRPLHKVVSGLKKADVVEKKVRWPSLVRFDRCVEQQLIERHTRAHNRVRDTTERLEYGDLGCGSMDHYRGVAGRWGNTAVSLAVSERIALPNGSSLDDGPSEDRRDGTRPFSVRKFLPETLPAPLREISTAWQWAAECGKSRKIAFAMGPKTRRFDIAALVRAAATHAHVSIA